MTIQLTKDTYVSGVLSAAGSQHTLDAQTESYLVHIGAATWVETAYTQGRFEDAKIEYDSDGDATGIVGRANKVVGPVWATDDAGNVTGLVGPDGLIRLDPGIFIPDYGSMSNPWILDTGAQAQGDYTDFGTDGTGSVTAQVADYAFLGASGVKLIWNSGGSYCLVGDQLAAAVAVPDGSFGVLVKHPGDQGVGFGLYLSNDTGWTNYALASISGNAAVANGWQMVTFAQSDFTKYAAFDFALGIRRWRISTGASATYPEVGFGGILMGVKSLPLVHLSCDDGWTSQTTVANPILAKYGYAATAYIVGSFVGNSNYMTAAQLLALQNDYGWAIANHGWGHLYYSTLNQTQMVSDYTVNRDYLLSIGANAPTHFAYPYGDAKAGTDASLPATVLSGLGATTGRLAAQTPYRGFQTYPGRGLVDAMHIKAQQMGGAANTVSGLKTAIDNAIARSEHLGLYFHKVLDAQNPAGTGGATPADGNEFYKDDFEAVIAYLKQKELAGSLRVVGNINDLYKILSGRP